MNKRVAIIGSSGGNLYKLGGNNPFALLGEIRTQLGVAGIDLIAVQFIAADVSMDKAGSNTKAKLISFENDEFKVLEEGKLKEINDAAKELDQSIANQILNDKIDGLILVSADSKGVNTKTIKAGATKGLPAVGTGGTSVANARSLGLNVVAASGTTGSTNRTRAVTYAAGLSSYWGLKYKPLISSQNEEISDESPLKRINFRGVMVTSLPAFVAMAVTIALSQIPGMESFSTVFEVMIDALPVVVSAIAAKQVSGYDEIGIVAGVIAGALSVNGGILGGIVGGTMAGILVSYLVGFSVKRNFPATTVNILAGGISGLIAGLVMYFGFAPIALAAGNGIRHLIEITLNYNAILAGTLAGLLIWPAIIGGVYHAAILPLILIEMEQYGHSFLGAIDVVGLGMVAIGITLANVIYPREKGDRVAAGSGLFVLTVFGTFVEAAYPFMFADKIVFGGALLSAALGGAVAGLFTVRGMGYVPIVVAPFISNNPVGFILSMLTAGIVAFIITISANKIYKSKGKHKKLNKKMKAEV